MPRKEKRDLPDTIERSPKHAREIWTKAHDSAVETYGEGGAAHRVAFSALKHMYKKEGDRWVKKDKAGPSDPQAARGPHHAQEVDRPRPGADGGRKGGEDGA